MSEKNESGVKNNNKDEELDGILDSALEDFQKDGHEERKKENETTSNEDRLWDEEFFAEQAKLLNEKMNTIFNAGGDTPSADQIATGFQKMAEAASVALQGDLALNDASNKYAETISEALKGLKDGVNNLQSSESESDIINMFSNFNLQEADNVDSNPFLPFMHGMMQSLLSAEILLPSIKELLDKYPKYLEDNSAKISELDKERYIKQQQLFQLICDDLESEKVDDTTEIKQSRFKRVLDHMQRLHEYGKPPEDLIGDMESDLPQLNTSGNNQQCPLM